MNVGVPGASKGRVGGPCFSGFFGAGGVASALKAEEPRASMLNTISRKVIVVPGREGLGAFWVSGQRTHTHEVIRRLTLVVGWRTVNLRNTINAEIFTLLCRWSAGIK
jgi:hypothetical protein